MSSEAFGTIFTFGPPNGPYRWNSSILDDLLLPRKHHLIWAVDGWCCLGRLQCGGKQMRVVMRKCQSRFWRKKGRGGDQEESAYSGAGDGRRKVFHFSSLPKIDRDSWLGGGGRRFGDGGGLLLDYGWVSGGRDRTDLLRDLRYVVGCGRKKMNLCASGDRCGTRSRNT